MGFSDYMSGREDSIEFFRLRPYTTPSNSRSAESLNTNWRKILEPRVLVTSSKPIELRDAPLPYSIKKGIYEAVHRRT
jgi:hypothetical protein